MKKNLWHIAFGRDCESGFPGCLHAGWFNDDVYNETKDYIENLVKMVENGKPIPKQDIPAIANVFMMLDENLYKEHPIPNDKVATKAFSELLEIIERLLDKPIKEFRGEYFFLSNFYECDVEYDGIRYKNTEAAFQAQKCIDPKDREQFSELKPGEAKRLGRRVKLRDDWEYVKRSEMEKIVRAKFTQNPDLAEKLLETGDAELVEGNTWRDTTWGVDLKTGKGDNALGKILMDIRDELWDEM